MNQEDEPPPVLPSDPRLRNLALATTDARSSRLVRLLQDELRLATTPTVPDPFPSLPPELLLGGDVVLAYQACDHVPISLTRAGMCRHLVFTGATGSGKTTNLHHFLLQANQIARPWILDLKGDTERLAAEHPGILIIDEHAPLTLLRCPSYLSPALHASLFLNALATSMWGGETTKALLTQALAATYATTSSPSFADLDRTIRGLARKGDTYKTHDAIDGLAHRLGELRTYYPASWDRRDGLGVEDLIPYGIYVPAPHL